MAAAVRKQEKLLERQSVTKLREYLPDLLFPRRCVVCDEITDNRQKGVCRECEDKIVYIRPPFCMKCGKQLNNQRKEYCSDCHKIKHLYIQGTALYEYAGMSDSLSRFKYASRREYALFFGRELAEKRGDWLRAIGADALVPVPIHSSRKRKRGYNQAQLIAEELSRCTGIPVNTKIIARVKRTLPQKELNDRQRQNNLKRAFKILQNDVKLSTIVIIDDIYTTGSTIDAMTEVLKDAGIERVYYMALAAGRDCKDGVNV